MSFEHETKPMMHDSGWPPLILANAPNGATRS